MIGAFKDFGPDGDKPVRRLRRFGPTACSPGLLVDHQITASGNHDGWLTPDAKTYYGVPFGGAASASKIRIVSTST